MAKKITPKKKLPDATPTISNPEPTKPPNQIEETLRQGYSFDLAGGFGGYADPAIVYQGDPNYFGFPLWDTGYWGTYQTYRFMLAHYKVRNVRSKVLNAMIDATWELRIIDESVSKKLVNAVKALLPLRRQLIEDAFRAVDFGWQGFEKIWRVVKGQYQIDRLKPLLVDFTKVITDLKGNFIGLSQGGLKLPRIGIKTDRSAVEGTEPINGLDRYKSFIYTYDREGTNHTGRSRLENFRSTAWIGWIKVAQQLLTLGRKVTGFQPIIKVPAGDFMQNGVAVSWRDNAEKAMKKLVDGVGIVLENLSLRRVGQGNESRFSDPDALQKLAQASLVDVDVIDFGNQGPTIEGLLKQLTYYDKGIVEGYLHNPEEVGDSEHSTRSNTQQHHEQGELDPMSVCSSMDSYINDQVVNQILELNAGPEARGLIELYTPAIKTAKVQMARSFIGIMVQSNHVLGEKIADALGDGGMNQLFLDANLKTSKAWKDTKSETLELGKVDNSKGNFQSKPTKGDQPKDGSQSGGVDKSQNG